MIMDTFPRDTQMIEAFARVVSVEDGMAWLEPEPKTSCGGCTSLACGAGNLSSRIMARRFSFTNDEKLAVGERVVVGVRESALLKAALTAYAIPLITMFVSAIVAQSTMGRDGITLAASVLGLALGLGFARLGADYLSTHDNMTPCFIRRAEQDSHSPNDTCHSNQFSGIETCKNT